MNTSVLRGGLLALAAALGLACFGTADTPAKKSLSEKGLESFKLPATAKPGVTPEQVARALGVPLAQGSWKKAAANEEKARGAGEKVYPIVAPATIVLRNSRGHGTGVLIDADGWALTNQHVVANGDVDPKTGARFLTAHLGVIKDGQMQLIETGVPAAVYKVSEEKDLALVKLSRLPPGLKKFPAIRLAKKAPVPGSDCVVLGHPAAGMLWTVRSGEVASVGTWPKDMIDVLLKRLALSPDEGKAVLERYRKSFSRKVLLSSCGLNPGDSGGPLANKDGELIGISFGVPRPRVTARGEEVRLDKVSYHVHLDEVKAFLADRPKAPLVEVPDPWPAGILSAAVDLDGDGKPDVLIFGTQRGKPMTGMLMDLDGSSPKLSPADLADPVKRRAWHFKFAFHRVPQIRAFYDTDNDGQIDLILVDNDGDGTADWALRREKGKKGEKDRWVRDEGKKRKMIDPRHFQDETIRKRFVMLVRKMVSGE